MWLKCSFFAELPRAFSMQGAFTVTLSEGDAACRVSQTGDFVEQLQSKLWERQLGSAPGLHLRRSRLRDQTPTQGPWLVSQSQHSAVARVWSLVSEDWCSSPDCHAGWTGSVHWAIKWGWQQPVSWARGLHEKTKVKPFCTERDSKQILPLLRG